MSASDKSPIGLYISGGNAGVEICLRDAQFGIVAEGLGDLQAQVFPGLYSVSYKFGEQYHEDMLRLSPGDGPRQVQPAWDLDSALPIVNYATGSPSPWQQDKLHFARQFQQADAGPGEGRLFVFASGAGGGHGAPLQHLLWQHEDGQPVHFGPAAQMAEANGRAYFGQVAALPAGHYLLNTPLRNERVQQFIPIVAHWETQLFYKLDAAGLPDPASLIVLFARPGMGLVPAEQHFGMIEAAIRALTTGNVGQLSREDLRDMLYSKFENPMLGLYWLHLYIQANGSNQDLMQTVVSNTAQMLPELPDVHILQAWLHWQRGEHAAARAARFDVPPLLNRTWHLLEELARAFPEVLPMNSFSAFIGTRRWGSTPYLCWNFGEQLGAFLSSRALGLESFFPDEEEDMPAPTPTDFAGDLPEDEPTRHGGGLEELREEAEDLGLESFEPPLPEPEAPAMPEPSSRPPMPGLLMRCTLSILESQLDGSAASRSAHLQGNLRALHQAIVQQVPDAFFDYLAQQQPALAMALMRDETAMDNMERRAWQASLAYLGGGPLGLHDDGGLERALAQFFQSGFRFGYEGLAATLGQPVPTIKTLLQMLARQWS